MITPLGVQAAVSAAWLIAYLVLSIVYHRRWDARLRAALGAKLGVQVGWAKVNTGTDPFSDEGTSAGTYGWHGETQGSLGRQLWQAAAIRTVNILVIVLLGALPPVALLAAEYFADFSWLVFYPSVFLVIPVFALYWAGTYRRH